MLIDMAMRQSLSKEDSFMLAVADIQRQVTPRTDDMFTSRTYSGLLGEGSLMSLCSSLADLFRSRGPTPTLVPSVSPRISGKRLPSPTIGAIGGATVASSYAAVTAANIKARANHALLQRPHSAEPSYPAKIQIGLRGSEELIHIPAWLTKF